MKKFIFYLFLCLCTVQMQAQSECACDPGAQLECNEGYVLPVSDGDNITEILKEAVAAKCQVVIPNPDPSSTVLYYVEPIVFSGTGALNTSIQDREIILDPGVILQGVVGGFRYCSQSIFTFDGSNNKNIRIAGRYEECENRPIIRMPQVEYYPDAETGYLVASDNSGEPYLNSFGEPNYVFDDGDSDPYFDNFGNPNIIPPGSNLPKVPKDCDYNYNLCNRKIVVWCPLNWEGRHIIAIHGAQYMTIESVALDWASGGDGLLVTDDEYFTPARNIQVNDVHMRNNARTGMGLLSVNCLQFRNCYIDSTGTQIGQEPHVVGRGGIAIKPNPNDPDMKFTMHNVYGSTVNLVDNNYYGMGFDFPDLLDESCSPPLNVGFDGICISGSKFGVSFINSKPELKGRIGFRGLQVNNTGYGIYAFNDWQERFVDIDLYNVDVSASSIGTDVELEPSTTFCDGLTVNDICFETSSNICGLNTNCYPQDNYACELAPQNCEPVTSDPCDEFDCDQNEYFKLCKGDDLKLYVYEDKPDIVAQRQLANSGWNNQYDQGGMAINSCGELCFTLTEEEKSSAQMIGLSANPDANASYNTINYAMYIRELNNSHRVYIFELGSNKGIHYTHPTTLVGSEFCIRRVNGVVTYYVDGNAIYTSLTSSFGPLFYDNSFFSTNNSNSAWYNGLSVFKDIRISKIPEISNITWSNGQSNVGCIIVSPSQSTTYTAEIKDENGCIYTITYHVDVANGPYVALAQNGPITCDNPTVNVGTPYSSTYSYQWEGPSGPIIPPSPGNSIVVTEGGTYCVTVTDNATGCTSKDCINVDEDTNAPQVSITGPTNTICVGKSTILNAITNISGAIYQWSDGSTSVSSFPITQTSPGTYTYSVTVTDPSNGCSTTAYYEVTFISCCPEVTDIFCFIDETPTGANILSVGWTPVPGAVGYDVIITANDPACCNSQIPPVAVWIDTTDPFVNVSNQINIPNIDCWSVMVRTDCGEGGTSDFTDPFCLDRESDCPIGEPCEVVIEPECDTTECCDVLFVLDASGSVSTAEWAAQEASVIATMNQLNGGDTGNCSFAVVQFGGTNDYQITYNFSTTPITSIPRAFSSGSTDVGAALQNAYDDLLDGTLNHDLDHCLNLVMFTDAASFQFTNAPAVAALLHGPPVNADIYVVRYQVGNADDAAANTIASSLALGGAFFTSNFGDPIDGLVGSITECDVLTVLDIPGCPNPTYFWTASFGGAIIGSNTGQSIQTNGQGVYTVNVDCGEGCGRLTGTYSFIISISNDDPLTVADRTVYLDDRAYTPYEYEMMMAAQQEALTVNPNITTIDATTKVAVFPNPFTDNITITKPIGNYKISVFDGMGRLQQQIDMQQDETKLNINTSNWVTGVLFIHCENLDSGEVETKRMINLGANR